ncbi:16S rRNA (guanine(527)-N(7))-methyltransferase RsmG [Microbaculum sp. FT89]|uniref:16S rRNA (guanine(527)-N(7))-methyltransferase RsmG n=1 Tax=Microbaculum sp. FT89 TaxID=3447298 RepID=UPI003F52B6E5
MRSNSKIDSDADRADGLALVRGLVDVSRETEAKLDNYVDELKKWSKAKNLVGPDTLSSLWTRHIADCAQAVACAPGARRWVDLGSGAGLPGMVVAILMAEKSGAAVHLVESLSGKCAFLRAAARRTGAPATVHCERIETFVERWHDPVDVVTARALAPLEKLLKMAAPMIARGAIAVFHKGQDVERELTRASTCWRFSYRLVPSRTQAGSALVIVDDCVRKSA